MEVLNPATGETIAEVPSGTQADVDRAVEAAKQALPEWLETTPQERSEALLKLAAAIEDHGEELAELESQNVGKPLSYARDEMPVSADNFRFFAGAARTLAAPAAGEYGEAYTSFIRREPIGIVGQITPWNYPLMMAIWKIGPALAAGNTVVLKPAELTPLTALEFERIALEAGLPEGVVNVVAGPGSSAGARLVEHPDVAKVAFTGSTEVGAAIAASAASPSSRWPSATPAAGCRC